MSIKICPVPRKLRFMQSFAILQLARRLS